MDDTTHSVNIIISEAVWRGAAKWAGIKNHKSKAFFLEEAIEQEIPVMRVYNKTKFGMLPPVDDRRKTTWCIRRRYYGKLMEERVRLFKTQEANIGVGGLARDILERYIRKLERSQKRNQEDNRAAYLRQHLARVSAIYQPDSYSFELGPDVIGPDKVVGYG